MKSQRDSAEQLQKEQQQSADSLMAQKERERLREQERRRLAAVNTNVHSTWHNSLIL